jgi:hypothetical protein
MAKSKRSKGRKGNGEGQGTIFPRGFEARPVMPMRIRYSLSAGFSADCLISRQDLVTAILAVATETTSAQATSVFSSARVRKVEAWYSNTSGMVRLQGHWYGDLYSRDKDYVDYGNEVRPAHIVMVPPKNSLAGNWFSLQNGAVLTNPLFEITGSSTGAATMDIHYDFVLADVAELATEAATEVTLSAAVQSGIYARTIGSGVSFAPTDWTATSVASIPLRGNKPPKLSDVEEVEEVATASSDVVQQLLDANRLLVDRLKAARHS